MSENDIAKILVDVFYQVHVKLGPGLLESVYEEIVCHELDKRGLSYKRQIGIPVIYEEKK